MVSVLASSAVDHWFEHRSGQTKDYNVIFVVQTLSHDVVHLALIKIRTHNIRSGDRP
jgi:hypothetical protein